MKHIATFDIETDGLLDDVTQVWCAVVKDHADGSLFSFHPDNIGQLTKFLDTFDVLIGHNSIAFDFPVLRKIYGWEYGGHKVDTLLMSRTQRPNRRVPQGSGGGPHSVESWGVRLGIEKKLDVVWDFYSPHLLQRCKQDVDIQYRILRCLIEEGHGEGWKEAHILNAKLFDLLQRQEEYGWLVDKRKIEANLAVLRRWIDRIDRAIVNRLPLIVEINETKKDGEYNYVRKPFKKDGSYSEYMRKYVRDNYDADGDCIHGPFARVSFRVVELNSNKEVKEYLLSLGWEPAEFNENKEGERTSAKLSKNDPFNGIQGGLGRLIAKRVQCRHRIGTLEGWLKIIRLDGRIAAKVGGIAATGRLRHKDIVNVPSPHSGAFFARQMREVFIAKPGWVLVGVDSKGNQIRQLAARMGDEQFMKDALLDKERDGTDFHDTNMARLGNTPRSTAKNFFYGLIFGAGVGKLASTIGCSTKEARRFLNTYMKELPLLKKCIDDLTEGWRDTAQTWWDKHENRRVWINGRIKGLDGRPILVDSEHKVLCYALQSDEAIQMAMAYVMFHTWASARGIKDWGNVIWMHDEIQFEAHPNVAEELAGLACEAIRWAGKYYNIACPHEGGYKIGKNWYETH